SFTTLKAFSGLAARSGEDAEVRPEGRGLSAGGIPADAHEALLELVVAEEGELAGPVAGEDGVVEHRPAPGRAREARRDLDTDVHETGRRHPAGDRGGRGIPRAVGLAHPVEVVVEVPGVLPVVRGERRHRQGPGSPEDARGFRDESRGVAKVMDDV